MSETGITERSQPSSSEPSEADKDRYIEIWKKAVETQMHFNEMSGKSRQLGLTFVAASLGVAVVMIARGDDFALSIWSWQVHVGVLLMLAGLLALWGVRGLDLNVYHRMLRGAVTFGEDFERNYMRSIFHLEKGMTQAISHYSRHNDANVDKTGPRYIYKGESPITAEDKIRGFYKFTATFLLLAALALFLINNFAQPAPEEVNVPVVTDAPSEIESDDGQATVPPNQPNQATEGSGLEQGAD